MYMYTVSGHKFYFELSHMHLSVVTIDDVAWSLAGIQRYNAHNRKTVSVAEHSIVMAKAAPHHLALAHLLHDAHEAYLGDTPLPYKQARWTSDDYAYDAVVQVFVITRLFELYGLPLNCKPSDVAKLTQSIDHAAAQTEMNTGFSPRGLPILGTDCVIPELHGMDRPRAYNEFIKLFWELASESKQTTPGS